MTDIITHGSRLAVSVLFGCIPEGREGEADEDMGEGVGHSREPQSFRVFSEHAGFMEQLFRWSSGKSGTGALLGSAQCCTFSPH